MYVFVYGAPIGVCAVYGWFVYCESIQCDVLVCWCSGSYSCVVVLLRDKCFHRDCGVGGM